MAWRTIVEKREVELPPKLAAAIERGRKELEKSDDWRPKPGFRSKMGPEAAAAIKEFVRSGEYRRIVDEIVRDDPDAL